MEGMDIPCKLCGHTFFYHQQVEGATWYCEAGNCPCDEFVQAPKRGNPTSESEKYRWN